MIEVSIQVCNGATRFAVAVRAESIEQAVSIVGRRYPIRDIRVKFPIDPERFFVEDPAVRAGIVHPGRPDVMAA